MEFDVNTEQRDEPMINANNTVSQTGRSGLLIRLPWIVAGLAVIAIVVLRWLAPSIDFGAVNAFTVLLGLVAWAACILGLRLSVLHRVFWQALLVGPFIALAVFLAFNKLERLDGELNPKFVSRWKAAEALPGERSKSSVSDKETNPNSSISEIPPIYLPRPTDYSQFLGPNRDGSVSEPALATDWKESPPEILWKQPIGEGWSSYAIQGQVGVTMEQRADQEWVASYDIESGELLWHHAILAKHTHFLGGTGPRSTPTIDNNKVYAGSAVGDVVCLDLFTGEVIWTQNLLELVGASQSEFEASVPWGRSGSPLIHEDLVLFPLGGPVSNNGFATLVAFDKASGKEVWRGGAQQISYSSPMLADFESEMVANTPTETFDREYDLRLVGTQILLIAESSIMAFRPLDGEVLWTSPWPGNSDSDASVSQPIQIGPNRVFLSKGYGGGCQVLEVTEKEGEWQVEKLWEQSTLLRTKFTTPVVHDGYAYGLSDGILECVDLANGEKQWKRGRYKQGQVLLVGELLLITAESGELVLVRADPSEFRELGRVPVIGDVSWNTAAISGNLLLMRNSNEAACVRLPIAKAD